VITSYNGNLASCYHTLSGDSSDPFPLYAGLLASVYPVGTTASITGSPPNNPFPIAEVQFYMGQNTFGKDEMQDIIDNQGGLINQAFWVVVTGFSQFSFKQLGITVGAFTGAFADLQTNHEGVTITANPAGPQFENGVNSTTPQTIRIPYDITFSNPVLAKFPGSGVSAPLDLSVTLTANGSTVSGSAASTQFEFIAAGDPYFNNVDSTGNQPYLSQDLRVFPAVPAINNVPFPNGPTFANDSVQGAYDYIQKLLHYLNTTSSFTNPAGTDPLTLLPFQGGEGQTDSSVAPYAFDFSGGLLPGTANSYSFAIARVRLRGIGTASSPATAQNVRVFFRLFGTQTNDTTYDPTGTYASQPDAAGHPGTPLVGTGNSTIPFFATGNPGAETDYQTKGVNNQTLVIPNGQNTLYAYYGCFLNLYDPHYKIGGQQIQAYLHGTHHCLVAQIGYDDAPIPTGVSSRAANVRHQAKRPDWPARWPRPAAGRIDDRLGQYPEGRGRLPVLARGLGGGSDHADPAMGRDSEDLRERCAHAQYPDRGRHQLHPDPVGQWSEFRRAADARVASRHPDGPAIRSTDPPRFYTSR
jgi:hypothetical protein